MDADVKYLVESEIMNLSATELIKPSGFETIAILLSLIQSGQPAANPISYREWMIAEYERNEYTFTETDLKAQELNIWEHRLITPVILLKSELPFRSAFSAGFEFQSALSGDEFYGDLTSTWSPSGKPFVRRKKTNFLVKLFDEAFIMAKLQNMWIHLGITIGWDYQYGIGGLEKFRRSQLLKYGKIIWQRTPDG